MPLDTIRLNFQYGYTGNSSLNTLATTKHNRTCRSMVNFIPMADGSVIKRPPVEDVVLDTAHKNALVNYFKNLSKEWWKDNLAFFVHTPGNFLSPTFIMTDGQTQNAKYFTILRNVDPTIRTINWIPNNCIGKASIKQFSIASVIVEVNMPQTFAQFVSVSGGYTYALYMQQITTMRGPCGSQENMDECMYAWRVEPVQDYAYWRATNPGDKIVMKFHPDTGINLRDYIGGTFAFNSNVTASDPFKIGVEYWIDAAVVYHGDNLYLSKRTYKPLADAPPPTHTTPGEILPYSDGATEAQGIEVGQWLYLNSGTGYAKLKEAYNELEGLFEIETALGKVHWCDQYTWENNRWPYVRDSSYNLPSYGPYLGYFKASAVAFDRLWLGGGRDAYSSEQVPTLDIDLGRTNTVWCSETADWENFDELMQGPTRARAISVSSRGGSPVLDLVALDPQTVGIFYKDGVSVLLMDAEGNISVKEAANMRPAQSPYGCKFGPYTCCIGSNNKTVVGAVYRYENNTQVTVDLLGPIYETFGDITIKRMYSVGGTPEKLVLLRTDGIITILFLINGSEIGFYDIQTVLPVFDISCAGILLYMFHMKELGNNDYQVAVSFINLEQTDYKGAYTEHGSNFEAKIEITSIVPPTDVSQETWISADSVRDIKITKSLNPLSVNGYDVRGDRRVEKVSLRDEAINEDDLVTISSNTGEALIIHCLEVAYKRATIIGNQ